MNIEPDSRSTSFTLDGDPIDMQVTEDRVTLTCHGESATLFLLPHELGYQQFVHFPGAKPVFVDIQRTPDGGISVTLTA